MNITKTGCFALALALSAPVFAGTYNAGRFSGFSVDASVEYSQPSTNGLGFGRHVAGGQVHSIGTESEFGYTLGISTIIPRDTRIGFDYQWYSAHDSDHFAGSNFALRGALPIAPGVINPRGKVDFDLREYRIYADHNVGFGPAFSVDFTGGFLATDLEKDLETQGSTPIPPMALFNKFESEFCGYGPEFGLQAHYRPFARSHYGFGLFMGAKTAFLWGERESRLHRYTNGFPTLNLSHETDDILARKVSGELGIEYMFNRHFDAKLSYRLIDYVDVFRDADRVHYENFARQGAVLKVVATF